MTTTAGLPAVPHWGVFTPLPSDDKTPLTKDQLAAAFGDVDSATVIFLRASSDFVTAAENTVEPFEVSNVPTSS